MYFFSFNNRWRTRSLVDRPAQLSQQSAQFPNPEGPSSIAARAPAPHSSLLDCCRLVAPSYSCSLNLAATAAKTTAAASLRSVVAFVPPVSSSSAPASNRLSGLPATSPPSSAPRRAAPSRSPLPRLPSRRLSILTRAEAARLPRTTPPPTQIHARVALYSFAVADPRILGSLLEEL